VVLHLKKSHYVVGSGPLVDVVHGACRIHGMLTAASDACAAVMFMFGRGVWCSALVGMRPGHMSGHHGMLLTCAEERCSGGWLAEFPTGLRKRGGQGLRCCGTSDISEAPLLVRTRGEEQQAMLALSGVWGDIGGSFSWSPCCPNEGPLLVGAAGGKQA
jgi:hypothetical protein